MFSGLSGHCETAKMAERTYTTIVRRSFPRDDVSPNIDIPRLYPLANHRFGRTCGRYYL